MWDQCAKPPRAELDFYARKLSKQTNCSISCGWKQQHRSPITEAENRNEKISAKKSRQQQSSVHWPLLDLIHAWVVVGESIGMRLKQATQCPMPSIQISKIVTNCARADTALDMKHLWKYNISPSSSSSLRRCRCLFRFFSLLTNKLAQSKWSQVHNYKAIIYRGVSVRARTMCVSVCRWGSHTYTSIFDTANG